MDNFDRNFAITIVILTILAFAVFVIWTGYEFSKVIEAQGVIKEVSDE